jgi:hypothetical protein
LRDEGSLDLYDDVLHVYRASCGLTAGSIDHYKLWEPIINTCDLRLRKLIHQDPRSAGARHSRVKKNGKTRSNMHDGQEQHS